MRRLRPGFHLIRVLEDPQVALSACRQSERVSVLFPAELRLQCFAAGVLR